jgi:hypothetical protein
MFIHLVGFEAQKEALRDPVSYDVAYDHKTASRTADPQASQSQ